MKSTRFNVNKIEFKKFYFINSKFLYAKIEININVKWNCQEWLNQDIYYLQIDT